MVRSLSPFEWGQIDALLKRANAPVRETRVQRLVTLDPDLDLWVAVLPRVTPFAGAPTEGIWPKGWILIDNASQMRVCTEGGEPGTWEEIGFSSAGVASFNTRTGAVVLTLADVQAVDYLPTPSGSGLFLESNGSAAGDWAWEASPFVDSGWVDISGSMENGWTPVPSGIARYRKINGVVYIELDIESGTNGGIYTLPAGFRPSAVLQFVVEVQNSGTLSAGMFGVTSAGAIAATNFDTSVSDGILATVSYVADA
jgi:hypothetical protein